MAFQNLKAEMTREKITQAQVAESMGMSTNNLNLKINEKIPMTVDEIKFIQSKWLPEVSLDALLESDGNVPSKAESLHAQAEVAYEAALDAEEISDAEAEELRGLLHECADTACEKKRQAIKA